MHTITRRLAGVALSLASVTGLFVATAPSAEAVTKPCIQQNFSYSLTTKPCVYDIQNMVNALFAYDYSTGQRLGNTKRKVAVDGKYGTETKNAIYRLQQSAYGYLRSNGRYTELNPDGVTGAQTWAVLCWEEKGTSAASKAGCVESKLVFSAVGLTETPHN